MHYATSGCRHPRRADINKPNTDQDKSTKTNITDQRKSTETTHTDQHKPTKIINTNQRKSTKETKIDQDKSTETNKTDQHKSKTIINTDQRKSTKKTKIDQDKSTKTNKTDQHKSTETTNTIQPEQTELYNPLSCPYCFEVMEKTEDFTAHFHTAHSFLTEQEASADSLTCVPCRQSGFDSVIDLVRHQFNVHTRLRTKDYSALIGFDRFHHYCVTSKLWALRADGTKENMVRNCSGVHCGFCGEESAFIQASEGRNIFEAFIHHFQTKHNVIKPNIFVHNHAWVYPCGICNEVFPKESEVKKHRKDSHKNIYKNHIQNKCPECEKVYAHHHHFFVHYNSIHRNMRIRCQKCDKAFDSYAALQKHVVHAHVYIKWTTKKGSVGEDELKNLAWFPGGRSKFKQYAPLECMLCNEQLANKDQFRSHFSSVHAVIKESDGNSPLYCELCDKTFQHPVDLVSHKFNVHTVFECLTCKRCLARDEMWNHCREHHGKDCYDKVFTEYSVGILCAFCDVSFDSETHSPDAMLDHLRTAHKIQNEAVLHSSLIPRLPCGFCDAVFSSQEAFEEHRRTQHANINLSIFSTKCPCCPKTFTRNYIALMAHALKVHISGRIQCPDCYEEFDTILKLHHHFLLKHRRALLEHTKKKTGQSQIGEQNSDMNDTEHSSIKTNNDTQDAAQSEDQSGKGGNGNQDLNRDSKEYNGKCLHCDQTFNDYFDLKYHMEDAHGIGKELNRLYQTPHKARTTPNRINPILRPKKCQECSLVLLSFNQWKNHMRKAHHASARKLGVACDQCDKILQDQYALRNHKQNMHSEQRFKCNDCDKTFGTAERLKKHQANHNKKYQCEYCSMAFASLPAVNQHVARMHHEVELVKCPKCDKMFKPFYLSKHMLTHQTERPFQCSTCAKCFKTKHTLAVHQDSHLEEKAHKCPQCAKYFKSKTRVAHHINLVHNGEKKHVCEHCSESFKMKHHLKAHMLKHTGERAFKCKVRFIFYGIVWYFSFVLLPSVIVRLFV